MRNPFRARLLAAILVCLAAGTGCREKTPPPPAPIPAPPSAPVAWTWHRLGGLLVVEGEVQEPVDLVLRGRYMNDRLHAEFGPVRWELYAPPAGEVAELRTADGRLLARWDFDAPQETPPSAPAAKPPRPPVPPKPPRLAPKPVPPKPPKPEPPPPVAGPVALPSPRVERWPETHLPTFKAPARAIARKAATAPTPEPAAAKPVAPAPQVAPPPVVAKLEPQPVSPPLPKPPAKPLPPVPEPRPIPPAPLPLTDLSSPWPGAGEALNLLRGPRGSHWVCLTFDGGSTAEVAVDVLDALKERRILTTFFLTGDFIQKYPEIVRRMNREGHEIGNHTQDHPHLAPGGRRDPRWTKERFQQQLLQADAAFLKLTGRPMDPYWRAPYGEHTAELRRWAEELGYRHVGWSEGADTLDWATVKERKLYRTGDAILDRLHDRMDRQDGDGLIVLMHLGSGRPEADRPARVLGPFLDQALDEGWNFVNISTYLQESGRPRWNASNRLAVLGGSAAGQTAHRP